MGCDETLPCGVSTRVRQRSWMRTPSRSSSRTPPSRTPSSTSNPPLYSPPFCFLGIFINVCRRLDCVSSFAYHATVRISPEAEELLDERDVQHRVEELPSELLQLAAGESPVRVGHPHGIAAGSCSARPPAGRSGCRRCATGSTRTSSTAWPACDDDGRRDAGAQGWHVPRPAHLGVTFCRALGIPARYVFGYMPDIGIPGPYPTMDFHAGVSKVLARRELVGRTTRASTCPSAARRSGGGATPSTSRW